MSVFTIEKVGGLQVLDSRGRPTIKAYVETRGGRGYGIAPSGASRGEREAIELRDGGRRWLGYGVAKALSVLESTIAPRLVGVDSRRQSYIDGLLVALDGTPNKSRLGGNTTTAVSIAVVRAAASTAGLEAFEYIGGPGAFILPVPLLNVINGGAHAANDLSIQEFMIIPAGADTFQDAMRMSVEVYYNLKKYILSHYGAGSVNVGDEGGFAPPMKKTREALDALMSAIRSAGYEPGSDFYLGLDAAASQFYDPQAKKYRVDGGELTWDELLEYYVSLVEEYPIRYIEDPFEENSFEHFSELTRRVGPRVLVTGDDLYTTNVRILEKGISVGATNSVLVKINQVGTITETVEFVWTARNAGMKAVISHRSGDTEDPFIADFAVGLGTGLIKTSAPARSERTAKYNRLLEIEYMLAGSAKYAGERVFR